MASNKLEPIVFKNQLELKAYILQLVNDSFDVEDEPNSNTKPKVKTVIVEFDSNSEFTLLDSFDFKKYKNFPFVFTYYTNMRKYINDGKPNEEQRNDGDKQPENSTNEKAQAHQDDHHNIITNKPDTYGYVCVSFDGENYDGAQFNSFTKILKVPVIAGILKPGQLYVERKFFDIKNQKEYIETERLNVVLK